MRTQISNKQQLQDTPLKLTTLDAAPQVSRCGRVSGAHKAGVDGVDAHAQLGVLTRECLSEMILRGLADIVGGRVGVDLDRAEAAEVHHRSVLQARLPLVS